VPILNERRLSNGKELHVREHVYRPELVGLPAGRVKFDGRTGWHEHEGDGWVRIYGDGQNYGFEASR